MASIRLFTNQSWLTERSRKAGYRSDNEGLCAGVAHMGKQAILADDMGMFDRRCFKLFDTPISTINKNTFDLTVAPFFEGVELYAQPHEYSELFGNNLTQQDSDYICQFTTPTSLEHNPITLVDTHIGAYNTEELNLYFTSLHDALRKNKINSPVALVLNNSCHYVTVGYFPDTDRWTLINANQLPSQYFNNPNELAQEIIPAFMDKEISIFSTRIYALASYQLELSNAICNWKAADDYKAIYTITSARISRTDSTNTSLIYMAAKYGDTELLELLIRANSDINAANDKGLTPLHIAANFGHLKCVELLISHGADMYAITNDGGHTPLTLARYNHKNDITNYLEAAIDNDELHKYHLL